jgi:hypothetical protein
MEQLSLARRLVIMAYSFVVCPALLVSVVFNVSNPIFWLLGAAGILGPLLALTLGRGYVRGRTLVRRPSALKTARPPWMLTGPTTSGRARPKDAASGDEVLAEETWCGDPRNPDLVKLAQADFLLEGESATVSVVGPMRIYNFASQGPKDDRAREFTLEAWSRFLGTNLVHTATIRSGDELCFAQQPQEEHFSDGYRDVTRWVLRGTGPQPLIAWKR